MKSSPKIDIVEAFKEDVIRNFIDNRETTGMDDDFSLRIEILFMFTRDKYKGNIKYIRRNLDKEAFVREILSYDSEALKALIKI